MDDEKKRRLRPGARVRVAGDDVGAADDTVVVRVNERSVTVRRGKKTERVDLERITAAVSRF